MRGTLHHVKSDELLAEIECKLQSFLNPETKLSGVEALFDVLAEHPKLPLGAATLRLEDGRQLGVAVEKVKRQPGGRLTGILWIEEEGER